MWVLLDSVVSTPVYHVPITKYFPPQPLDICFLLPLILSEIRICAEPSTGVDPVSRRGMWAVIAGAKRRRAVALTTHSLEEADALCDRIGIMCNGAMQVCMKGVCVGGCDR